MNTIQTIDAVTIRRYSDTGQTVAYVYWTDHDGNEGRTEGFAMFCETHGPDTGAHMEALIKRAGREGVTIRGETW